MNGKENRKRMTCYLLAFFLPVVFMLIISIWHGFYPFGNTSILLADMRYQFVDYHGYMKSVFFGNNDMFYTFSKTFGGDMLGFAAYYLFSLPNLILLLFPNEMLPAGLLIMAILMIGGCGLTFNMLLDKLYSTRWASLIFSTAYAMMGYMLAYFNCTHYFTCVLLLPLVIRGLCNMIHTGKISPLYVVTLFLSIFCNYYIGYMTCLFTIIFFVYYVISEAESWAAIKTYWKALLSYVAASAMAVGMTMISLLPIVFSLSGQKSGVSEANLSFSRAFRLLDVFSGLYSTSFHGNISDGLPIIYCGVTTVLFAMLYLVNKNASKRERFAAAGALLVMLLCFYVNALNIIWHGFNEPIGFPYRDSFFLSFLLVFIGYKGFMSTYNGVRLYRGVICVILFVIYSGYLLVSKNVYVGRDQVVLAALIITVDMFFIYGFTNKKEYVVPLIVGLFLVQSIDLVYNGSVSIGMYFDGIEENPDEYSIQEFASYVTDNEEILDAIQEKDAGFYRTEKTYRRSNNDAMLLNYNGLSHFSSCETEQVKSFMGDLGFRNNENWAFYGEGSTSFADSLMGVKYLLSQYDETAKAYPQIFQMNNKFIYQNPRVLPLVFETSTDIRNVDKEDYNLFTYQNAIASSFTGNNYKIYRPVTLQAIELTNVEQAGNRFKRIDSQEEAYVTYKLKADSTDFIYMYFDAPKVQDTRIVINDLEKEPYFTTYGWMIREAGHFDFGEDVELRIYLNQDEIRIDQALFYYENKDELDRWYQDAATDDNLTKITSSHLTGQISCEPNELVVFSIPYEDAWTVKVDGKKIETEKVLNALLAINPGEGTHTLEMRYIPKGLLVGSVISIVALICFIAVLFYQAKGNPAKKKS